MPNQGSIAGLRDSLEPRPRQTEAQETSPAVLRELLAESSRALQATVGELREARTALAGARGEAATDTSGDVFGGFFAGAPDALLVTDEGGKVRHANAACAALLGVRRDDLPGLSLDSFVADTGRAAVRQALAAVAESGEPHARDVQLTPRRGASARVRLSAWRCGGEPDGIAWSIRPEPVAEPDAGSDAAGLRAMLDSLPAAAAAMDLDGTILTWNRAAERLLGWSEDELAGRSHPAMSDALEGVLEGMRAAGAEAEPCSVIAAAATRDGATRKVELSLAPLADAAGGVTGTVALMRPAGEPAPSEAAADQRRPWSPNELRRVLMPAGRGEFAARLRAGIAAGVHTGHLRAGDRLPSIREAAQLSETDHRVVSSAYQRLAADGLVEVRNRRGVVIAPLPRPHGPELNETAEWLARVLEEASELQVRVPHLPDLVRRWTAAVPLHCLCVDATEDARLALSHEMSHQWGMQASAVSVDDAPDASAR
ncbi:MAG: PAS domain S-box protein, partial [Gemmatimonadetes bacterium]|nr:PAS domain S-box protein [Gemmatimonadota bacterium]